jgi:pimeloyl-ACP methyl ester carboxylesterase
MTEHLVPVPGSQLYAVDGGPADGPPILLLHASIVDSRSWESLVPLLGKAGFRTIRYDRRGFGRSVTEAVEFSNRADAIAVLDALGIARATLVGNSAGGQIAFDTAIEYPDRVAAVVGVAPGLGGLEIDVTPDEQAAFEEMDRLESADPPDPAAIADFDVRFWVDGLGQPTDRVPPWIREAVREMDAAGYAPGHVDGRPIPLQPPAAERLADLGCPVLAIAGELDVSDVAATARYLEAHAPDARAVVLPDVAHLIGMEAPDRLATLIDDFLRPLVR